MSEPEMIKELQGKTYIIMEHKGGAMEISTSFKLHPVLYIPPILRILWLNLARAGMDSHDAKDALIEIIKKIDRLDMENLNEQ